MLYIYIVLYGSSTFSSFFPFSYFFACNGRHYIYILRPALGRKVFGNVASARLRVCLYVFHLPTALTLQEDDFVIWFGNSM